MTYITHQITTTVVFAFVFTNIAFAADRIKNENKNYSISNTVSDVNHVSHTDGDSAFTSDKDVNTSPYNKQVCFL